MDKLTYRQSIKQRYLQSLIVGISALVLILIILLGLNIFIEIPIWVPITLSLLFILGVSFYQASILECPFCNYWGLLYYTLGLFVIAPRFKIPDQCPRCGGNLNEPMDS